MVLRERFIRLIRPFYGAFDLVNGIPETKLLLTVDEHDWSQKGVRWKNIIDWLLEKC